MAQTKASKLREDMLISMASAGMEPDHLTMYPEYNIMVMLFRNVDTGQLFRRHLMDSKQRNFSTTVTRKGMCVTFGGKYTQVHHD